MSWADHYRSKIKTAEEALIQIAHPDFQDEVAAEAEKLGFFRRTPPVVSRA